MSDDERKRLDVALFRFSVISPLLQGTVEYSNEEYYRRVTQTPFDVPHRGAIWYQPPTIKGWLNAFNAGGLDALVPRLRSDAGTHRAITPALEACIKQLLAERPRMSASLIRERLVDDGLITTKSPSESVIRRFIRDNGLRVLSSEPENRRCWSKDDPNELWMLDYMHGPALSGSRHTTRLLVVLDDASRYVVLGTFLLSETYADLAPHLVDAFVRHGVPMAMYCDNGASFSSRDLTLACARLEIGLIHSKPYMPQGRGKVERFMRTVRDRFLAGLESAALESLDSLNSAFADWLERDYHRRVHSSLGTTPLARFLDSKRPKRWVARQQLDLHFYNTLRRKVRADSTVSVDSQRWEVPPEWIGHTVEIRRPLDDPSALTLFADGKPLSLLKPVDTKANDRANRRAHFATNTVSPEDAS